MTYRFAFKSSYMGCVWYEVTSATEQMTIQVRHRADDYERSIYNHGSPSDWDENVVATIDMVQVDSAPHGRAAPLALVEAFNAWRASEHERFLAAMRSQPERYGELDEDDPIAQPPRPCLGSMTWRDGGWRVERLDTAPAA